MREIQRRRSILAVILFLVLAYVTFAIQAQGTQTETISTSEPSREIFQYTAVQTATAANEKDCVDTRGYDYVCYFANVGGTINVDIDRFYTDDTVYTGAVVDEWNADIVDTTDETGCEIIKAPYYCYDVDSSTSGTLSLTWTLIKVIR